MIMDLRVLKKMSTVEELILVKIILMTQEFAETIQPYELSYNIHTIPSQNWNAVWEEYFEPVMVHDFVGIRAHFHPSLANEVQYEILLLLK